MSLLGLGILRGRLYGGSGIDRLDSLEYNNVMYYMGLSHYTGGC